MKTFETILSEINATLTNEQIQLLKDTINHGCWGDTSMEFLDENGNEITTMAMGYCTNDAKNAGHFNGRKVSAMFRSIYNHLYKQFENFIADCTLQECYDNEKAIKAIETMLHQRMRKAQ